MRRPEAGETGSVAGEADSAALLAAMTWRSTMVADNSDAGLFDATLVLAGELEPEGLP